MNATTKIITYGFAVLIISDTSFYAQTQQAEGTIACGQRHTLVLCYDSTVWGVGNNSSGQIGNGNFNTPVSAPQQAIASGVNKIKFIDAGGWDYSLALDVDGNAWGWGDNYFGQLGIGNNTAQSQLVKISAFSNNVKAVAAGWMHALILKNDGTVWAMGRNDYGQLGNGASTNSNIPVQTMGLTGIVAISGGHLHSLALKSDSTVWVWGQNFYGLGDGVTTQSYTPVKVSGLNNVIKIISLRNHSLALKIDGTVWAWGQGNSGQLGDGLSLSSGTPVQVSGLTNIKDIGAGDAHSIALKDDGTVWTWGNATGILSTTPTQLPLSASAIAIGTGYDHTIVRLNDSTIWGLGSNSYIQLGSGIGASALVPTKISFCMGGTGTTTETDEQSLKNDIIVYPNPVIASNMLYIHLQKQLNSQPMTVKLYNIVGEEIQKITMTVKEGKNDLPVSNLKPGIYFYKIDHEINTIKEGKLVVY